MKKRIFYKDNTTLTDYSVNLQDFHNGTQTFSFVASEDKLYIGSFLPFNHFKIIMGLTVNAVASVMSIKYWDGGEWRSAVETIDETSVSGKSLAQSGFVTFVPNKNYGWSREDTVDSSGTENITNLGGITIYDKYWIEISFSVNLTASVKINWIGQLFSNDDDVKAEFPDLLLTNTLAAFESDKTDWDDQHYTAANIIINDLTAKGLIISGDQILAKEDLRLASVQKVASIIYNALGDDFIDQYAAAEKEYARRIEKALPVIDKNRNAIEDRQENQSVQGRLIR